MGVREAHPPQKVTWSSSYQGVRRRTHHPPGSWWGSDPAALLTPPPGVGGAEDNIQNLCWYLLHLRTGYTLNCEGLNHKTKWQQQYCYGPTEVGFMTHFWVPAHLWKTSAQENTISHSLSSTWKLWTPLEGGSIRFSEIRQQKATVFLHMSSQPVSPDESTVRSNGPQR